MDLSGHKIGELVRNSGRQDNLVRKEEKKKGPKIIITNKITMIIIGNFPNYYH